MKHRLINERYPQTIINPVKRLNALDDASFQVRFIFFGIEEVSYAAAILTANIRCDEMEVKCISIKYRSQSDVLRELNSDH